jgi:hypothetical protein
VRRNVGQRGRDASRPWLIAAVVLGLFVLVAVVMPDGAVLVGDTHSDRVVVPDLPLIGEYLLVGVWLGMVVAWFVLRTKMLPARGFGIDRQQRSPWVFWISVTLFFVVWAVSPSIRDGLSELFDRVNPMNDGPGGGQAIRDSRPDVEGSRAFGWVVTFAMAALVTSLILTWKRVFGGRTRTLARTPRARLVEEIDASIDDLYSIDNPRRAVIACFSRMQKLAGIAGTEQDPSDTPFEFVERMLLDQNVSSDNAHRLTELFERARFSEHAIDESMRIDALGALTSVRDELMAVHA